MTSVSQNRGISVVNAGLTDDFPAPIMFMERYCVLLKNKCRWYCMELIVSTSNIVAGFFGLGIGMLITFYTMKKKNEKK